MQRLYNIAGGGSRVSGVNMGNFYTVCTARGVGGGARHPASLMHSLRYLPFLPPAGEKAPQGNFCHERRSACTPLAKNSSLALVFLECRGKSHQKRPLKPMVSTLPLRGFGALILPLSATRIGLCITSASKPALSYASLCAAALPLFGRRLYFYSFEW